MRIDQYAFDEFTEAINALRDAERMQFEKPDRVSQKRAEEGIENNMAQIGFLMDKLPLAALCDAFELCLRLGLNPDITAYTEGDLFSIRDALTKAGVL